MHDVGWHQEVSCVRSKDAQKQLARTSLKHKPWRFCWQFDDFFCFHITQKDCKVTFSSNIKTPAFSNHDRKCFITHRLLKNSVCGGSGAAFTVTFATSCDGVVAFIVIGSLGSRWKLLGVFSFSIRWNDWPLRKNLCECWWIVNEVAMRFNDITYVGQMWVDHKGENDFLSLIFGTGRSSLDKALALSNCFLTTWVW